jgi:mRNA interferase MazF
MKRGEIWTAAGGKNYASKPRPVLILQDDRFDETESVTVCAFTTDPTEAPLFRLGIEPNDHNGLRLRCRLMVDKIATIPRSKLGERIGRLNAEDLVRVNRAVIVFLGLASASRRRRT